VTLLNSTYKDTIIYRS